ncbi:hypothetical protein PYCC9005_004355 [Savitreella phatthalungensis]
MTTMADDAVQRHAEGFLDFINAAPTVFHAVDYYAYRLQLHGFIQLHERDLWDRSHLDARCNASTGGHNSKSQRFFVTRNSSAIIAFVIPPSTRHAAKITLIGTHLDAVTAKLKPISRLTSAGFELCRAAPYGGGMGRTWWDRDLGIGGRVVVREGDGKRRLRQVLMRSDGPVGKICTPSLAGVDGAEDRRDWGKEDERVPIVGLVDGDKKQGSDPQNDGIPINDIRANHSHRLIDFVARHIGYQPEEVVDFELEFYDHQPATRLGLDGELLSVPRCDDKLCSYAALEALIESADEKDVGDEIHMVACFDDEEVGSELRQGAASNFADTVIRRLVDVTRNQELDRYVDRSSLLAAVVANSFMISADVEHAVNPNFEGAYGFRPRLNTGICLCCDANANVTTELEGKVKLAEVARRAGVQLQLSQIRNGEPSGGTIGPMLSSSLGMRSADMGIVQLGMHSIRGTMGADDPGLGVRFFKTFFHEFTDIDEELMLD